ncbi:MAG: DUF756 domain-containing protein [Chitinophagaceae bacterium]|nr:MAG: DUF756 domain-containing protein [Chitinophagaceae bacterium]
MPKQEPGTRIACPLPYELYADGKIEEAGDFFSIRVGANNKLFGKQSAGAPFYVYAYKDRDVEIRNYAVIAGDHLTDKWALDDFKDGIYHFCVHGPNGFFREFKGKRGGKPVTVLCNYVRHATKTAKLSGNIKVVINTGDASISQIDITDQYQKRVINKKKTANKDVQFIIGTTDTHGWYDFIIRVGKNDYSEWRFAGRLETGEWTRTDPAMGNLK